MTPTLPATPNCPTSSLRLNKLQMRLMIMRLFWFLSIYLAVKALQGFNAAVSQTTVVYLFSLLQSDR